MKPLIVALALSFACVTGYAVAGAPPAALTGRVLETKDAGTYTYLRLQTKDGETWAAVGRATVKVGSEVTIVDPMVMTDFESRAMQRKFDRLVLGTLRGAEGAPAPAANPHAGVAPHGRAVDVGDVKVAKATGADARTVGEVYAQKTALKDKRVQVRGKVVKVTGEVMGKNWVHLRDGTGSPTDRTDDLVVTTRDEARVGDVIVVSGIVRVDRNFGSGYAYPVLIEDAKLR